MARKQPGGHPAKQDPHVALVFRTMRAAVELVRDMDGRLTPDNLLNLKASALGLMHVYAELTGLPAPTEYVQTVQDAQPAQTDLTLTA